MAIQNLILDRFAEFTPASKPGLAMTLTPRVPQLPYAAAAVAVAVAVAVRSRSIISAASSI